MNFFERVEKVFETWHYDHPRILYSLMRSLKPEIAVEVGTYRGYAACYMAQALKENGRGHLYCIDDFSEGMQQRYGSDHWCDNLRVCGVLDWVTLIQGKSVDVAWPDSVDFAYIDGWHGYRTVALDFQNAARRGAECICLDDVVSTVGPALMAQRLRDGSEWGVCEIFRDCGLAICSRRMGRVLTFSQESESNSGVVMTGWTMEQKREFLVGLTNETGVEYADLALE